MSTSKLCRPARRRLSLALLSGAILAGSLAVGTAASARPLFKRESIEQAAPMASGAPVAPPIGFIEFCARMPAQCGVSSGLSTAKTEQDLYSRYYWRAAFSSRRIAPQPAAQWSLFRGRSAAGAQADASPSPAVETPAPFVAEVKPNQLSLAASLEMLQRINSSVNRSMRNGSDAELYGVGDYWNLPTGQNGFGDCEDHALAKRAALLEAGVPMEAMSIALSMTRWGEAHAVLLVSTDRGELVLDSLTSRIKPWNKVNYQWLVRQAPGSTFDWVTVS